MNIRSIDARWGEDDLVYFNCKHGDPYLRKCQCYHNGRKFVAFYNVFDTYISNCNLAENGLVIMEMKKEEINDRQYNSGVANLWYRNGKLHNERGAAFSCCWGFGGSGVSSWAFQWHVNGKPWKVVKNERTKTHKFDCIDEIGACFKHINGKRVYLPQLIDDFYGTIPIN
jgi:hypothetical protein